MKYTVEFETSSSLTVHVEADDPGDAIEKAVEESPGSICAHCSGWGHKWSRDEGDYEPYFVTDESGDEVWSTPTFTEHLSLQLATAERERNTAERERDEARAALNAQVPNP